MALKLNDRVKETSTTTGTGTLDLSGAVTAFETFVAGIGDGNTTYYAIVNRDEDEWEVGLGTVTDASTDTLARTTVISSSNSDSAVDFSAGTKDVFCTLPASKIANLDASDNLTIGSGSAGVDYTLTFDGADSDGVITWMEDEDHLKFSDDVVMDSTKKLYFYDEGGEYISSDGSDLSIVAGDDIHLDATGNTWKFLTNTTLRFYIESNSGEMSFVNEGQDLDQLFKGSDGGVAITALKLDMSDAGAATFNDKVIATELDISGNIDIDGTSNLDAVDIDGAVQIDATFTSGVDGQGYDTKFFGDTASAYMLWDTSADDLILAGGAGLIVPDGQFTLESTAVTSTAAELNLLDTASANSVVNSKAVIYGSSGELAGTLSTAAQTSVTSLGTLTALTVDDIALNGKVVTMTGSASDTAVFTAGTDGTLSIVTTDAAAAAANIQITADGTVDIDSVGVLTLDSGAAINIEPASGSAILLDGTISVDAGVVTGATSITSTAFVGDITGDVTGNASGTVATVTTAAQSNITSLGTLTTLTVDNVNVNGTTIGHTSDTDLLTFADGLLTVAGEVSMTTLDIGGTNITSTAAELNILDGVTSTAAELNILDGVTSTAAELNLIDGGTARGTDALADGDGILINDGGTMKMTNVTTVKTYMTGTAATKGFAIALAVAL